MRRDLGSYIEYAYIGIRVNFPQIVGDFHGGADVIGVPHPQFAGVSRAAVYFASDLRHCLVYCFAFAHNFAVSDDFSVAVQVHYRT